MSQYDFGTIDPYVVDGVELASMLNNWRDALYTMQRGPTRPAFAVPGQLWTSDVAGPTDWQVNYYVSPTVGDTVLFSVDTTTGAIVFNPAGISGYLPLAGGALSGTVTGPAFQGAAAGGSVAYGFEVGTGPRAVATSGAGWQWWTNGIMRLQLLASGVLSAVTGMTAPLFRAVAASNPKKIFEASGNATDQKKYQILLDGSGNLVFASLNDAESATGTPVMFDRFANITASAIVIATPPAGNVSNLGATTEFVASAISAAGGGLKAKVHNFDIDVSQPSFTQTITGIGFAAKSLQFFAGNPTGGSNISFNGHCDATLTQACIGDAVGNPYIAGSVVYLGTAGTTYVGAVTAIGADGFDIQWTRTGAPTGTFSVSVMCHG
jgi:hypothetical protein